MMVKSKKQELVLIKILQIFGVHFEYSLLSGGRFPSFLSSF
jgi:hypothetical protein